MEWVVERIYSVKLARAVSRLIEDWIVVAGTIVGFVVTASVIGRGYRVNEFVREVVPTAVAAAAILAGFQVSAESVLTTIANRRIVQQLRKLGHMDRLFRFLRRSRQMLFGVLTLGLLLMLCRAGGWQLKSPLGIAAAWTSGALMAGALVSSYRVGHVMVHIQRAAQDESVG